MRISVWVFGLMVASSAGVLGDDKGAEPRPVPLTRPEMKEYIENMKLRKPRIPLPELTVEEKAKLGERGAGYESRLRSVYMAGVGGGGGGLGVGVGGPGGPGGAGGAGAAGKAAGGGGAIGRNLDPNMTLDYAFKTELFWIVSRTNNCQYCLGHQESKLLGAGLKEEEIAALDGDWSEFTPAQRAAFALARKITYEPHKLTDADIDAVRKHYKDLQVLEMVLSVAGNNSLNRWKEGVGVPQSSNGGGFGRRTEAGAAPAAEAPKVVHTYLTPTPDKFKSNITKVAPLVLNAKTGEPTRQTVFRRPPLESREDVEKALAACRARSPRLPLVDADKAREIVSENWPEGSLPEWARLVANFPRDGVRYVASVRQADEKGDLSRLLKAQVSWIVARQDRAWYALGQAKQSLKELGQTDDQIYALDGDWSGYTPSERALFTVARQLAASPVVLTDDDVALAVKFAGPRDTVQLISYTTTRASFDRITEAAGLRSEK
jgi:Carboxymuconolactone decarboxylase family